MVVHQMLVCMLAMLRIERVIAYHIQRRLRQIILYYMVQVFIVSPAHVYIFQSTPMFIYTILGIVTLIIRVGVCGKIFRVHNLVRVCASNRECITYHRPLWLTKEA